jgi:hypothetical protein
MPRVTEASLREHRESAHFGSTRVLTWWLKDAKGIPCCKVCADCEDVARKQYKPEIFNVLAYEDAVEEPIEPD